MLEQFHPREAVELPRSPSSTASPGAWRPTTSSRGCRAGPGVVRLERAGGDRRAHRRATSAPASPARRSGSTRRSSRRPRPPWRRCTRAGTGSASGCRRGAQRARRRRLLAGGRRADRADVRGHRDHPEAVRRLVAGKDVKHEGRFFKMETTRLWTLPETAAADLVATAGPITAKRTGKLADGIITVGAPDGEDRRAVRQVRRGRARGGQGPRHDAARSCSCTCPGPTTDEEALANAMTEWPNGGMKFPKQDIRSPLDFEQMAKLVRPEDFEGRMLISSDPDVHRARDPEVRRPRLRPDLPAQRRAQPGRVDRGLRPRRAAQAHPVTT